MCGVYLEGQHDFRFTEWVATCNSLSVQLFKTHIVEVLNWLCPTCGPWAACGEGFVQPSLGFCCSKSILHTDNWYLFW